MLKSCYMSWYNGECMGDIQSFSDEQLQAASLSGDVRCESILVERYAQLVRICARPYYLSGGDSEDLIQEGMIGLWYAVREFRPEKDVSFHHFAEVCIRRRIFSAIRSASRGKHTPLNHRVSLEDAFGGQERHSAAPDLFDPSSRSPEELVLAKERSDEFFASFSRCLSPFEQRVLHLFLDGFSYQDIAAQCGKDVKSVDNAVQRVRRKLARNFQNGDPSDELNAI